MLAIGISRSLPQVSYAPMEQSAAHERGRHRRAADSANATTDVLLPRRRLRTVRATENASPQAAERDGDDGNGRFRDQALDAVLERLQLTRRRQLSFGKDAHQLPTCERRSDVGKRALFSRAPSLPSISLNTRRASSNPSFSGIPKGRSLAPSRRTKVSWKGSPHGAIFLDEIGEVSVPVQIKLLDVLQGATLRASGQLREQAVRRARHCSYSTAPSAIYAKPARSGTTFTIAFAPT
jgi:hypothetical protein